MPPNRFKSALMLTLSLLLLIAYAHSESDIDLTVDDTSDVTVEVEDDDTPYVSPKPSGSYYFAEDFDDPSTLDKKWVRSEAKRPNVPEELASYDGKWKIAPAPRDSLKGDLGLVLESKARHAALSAPLRQPFYFNKNPLIVQYEALFPDNFECGGSYLKLISHVPETKDLKKFTSESPYTIMFGPDKCGSEHKLHFIFRHKNPLNGTISEKHLKKPKERLEEQYKDKLPHLYSLFVYPDNTFTVKLDGKVIKEGSLLEDFDPPVNPEREIDDPNDHKPKDWDEQEKIPDPEARKPDDWDEDAPEYIPDMDAVKPQGWLDDEPEFIPDTEAVRPDDWDEEIDGEWDPPNKANPACEKAPGCGEWIRPTIKNPEYKGKWNAPLISNPNYMGKWKPRKIPNPDFYEDKEPFKMTPISAVGFELWSMAPEIHFDNIIITDDPAVADQWAMETFFLKRRKLEKSSESVVTRFINYTNERPWLYAVYVVAIGLPIVLIFVFCCGSQDSDRRKRSAEAKKTDLQQPDDEEQEPEPEDEDEGLENEPAPNIVNRASKSDLEVQEEEPESPLDSVRRKRSAEAKKTDLQQPDDEEQEQEQEPEPEDEDEGLENEPAPNIVNRASKNDLEVQEEEPESPLEAEAAGDAPRSPRKRRPRKD